MQGEHIHIDGIVQGVGFRPFVYRLARAHALSGWVRNSSQGVDIEVWGPDDARDAFARALQAQAPPLARITAIRRHPLPANGHDPAAGFVILASRDETGFTLVSPDVATCPDCLRELFDPTDCRYRYPFINCTNCGPRFSIIQALPYDRPATTMAPFVMCDACRAEYENPLDRRFHAQPNACPHCGPHIWLEMAGDRIAEQEDALRRAEDLLLEGRILAVKGLGGFHLACDATNHDAVMRLRQRKQRPHKPLAVMMPDLATVRRYCRVSPAEAQALTSPAAPIVLLFLRPDTDLSPAIAPGLDVVGVMLPYTPLHHLLLRDLGRPLVMTSGNRRDEPIARTNDDARANLGPLADAFLCHNRAIHNRNDDSVILIPGDAPLFIRRSRGHAPEPIPLAHEVPTPVLALGSYMKNTFCLLTRDKAFLSQHIGEMADARVWDFQMESIRRFLDLFRVRPERIAHDLHPDFAQIADAILTQLPDLTDLPRVPVQHHHAHIAACLAENNVPGPVIGLAWDGTGYGPDGTVWGGEFLIADLGAYRRVGRFTPFPLPGNEAAIRQPWRIAVGLIARQFENGTRTNADERGKHKNKTIRVSPRPSASMREEGFWGFASLREIEFALIQARRGLNSPLTSSVGRLFDAVAAVIGLRGRVSYEGQAAMELEALARAAPEQPPWPIRLQSASPLIEIPSDAIMQWVVEDLRSGVAPAIIARRFHATLIAAAVDMVERIAATSGLRQVALSGGCFLNRILLTGLTAALRARGFTLYTHRLVPPGDGGIALGQAVIAGHASAVEEKHASPTPAETVPDIKRQSKNVRL